MSNGAIMTLSGWAAAGKSGMYRQCDPRLPALFQHGNAETGYAISILPLVTLAMDVYGDDPCDQFRPKPNPSEEFTDNEIALLSRMHKAIAIIQLGN